MLSNDNLFCYYHKRIIFDFIWWFMSYKIYGIVYNISLIDNFIYDVMFHELHVECYMSLIWKKYFITFKFFSLFFILLVSVITGYLCIWYCITVDLATPDWDACSSSRLVQQSATNHGGARCISSSCEVYLNKVSSNPVCLNSPNDKWRQGAEKSINSVIVLCLVLLL